MKRFKLFSVALCLMLAVTVFAACGSKTDGGDSGGDEQEAKTLSFAYQYGLQYLPAKIVKEQQLIEKYYDGDVTVDWKTLASGAEVNEAIIAGTLQGGFVGPPPAITGVTNGVPYKIFTGLSKIPNRMMVNDSAIKTLSDVKSDDKIALVGEGSTQHIMLAMAAKKELGDAHALDTNIVGMPHPDGMTALLGKKVAAQVTSMPYSYIELNEEEGITQIEDFVEEGIPGSSQIVGVFSTEIYESDPALYEAVVKAFEEANDYLNDKNNFDAIAESIYEDEGITKEQALAYLNNEDTVYAQEVTGLMELAKFMIDEGFLEKEPPAELSGLCFDGVTE